jgi:hypothetical protein
VSSQGDRLSAALAGRYRIERELGAGGMATVYLAEDLKHDRKVAIKVLKPELAAVLGAERFVVEIKTTASMSHPHILPLFDSGTVDGFLFYVMPYIQGETIREKLNRESQFGVGEAVRIASEVADALDYAHRHGVIHRDIKPENILLHDGRAMVMDFGIALAVSAAAGGRMTETGLSLGTPHYMSPEQATAEKEITPKSDVYSLASVLYEMLSGEPPHTGGTAQAVIMKIITDVARPVSDIRRNAPPNVVAALSKALEKLPADRFESAKAFRDALVSAGFATASTAAFAMDRAGRGVSRNAFYAAAAIAILMSIALLATLMRPASTRAVNRFSFSLPDSQAISRGGGVGRFAISPDGRSIAYVAGTGAVGRARIMLRSLSELTIVAIPGTEGGYNPSFSPDGKRIAFMGGEPRSLRVVPVAGGPVTTLTSELVDEGGVSWGTDGYIYFDGHLEGDGVARIKEGGGTPEIATKPDAAKETYHFHPHALPEGRGLLYTISAVSGFGDWMIGVRDSRSGVQSTLVKGVLAAYSPTGHLLYVTGEGQLMAAPFDLDDLRLTGAGVPLASGLAVTGNSNAELSLAADGTLGYIAGRATGGPTEIVRVTRDNRAVPVDSAFIRPFEGWFKPSRDQTSVIVGVRETSKLAIWVKKLDRGPASKLAEGEGWAWSSDGRSIYFTDPVKKSIERIAADGSAPAVTVFNAPLASGRLETTPDGQWLIHSENADIVGRRLRGDTAVVRFIANAPIETWPTVSPDGRWLLYSSDESGKMQVYVRPFPDVNKSKQQLSTAGGYIPAWSPEGREVFFINDNLDLVAVPVTPGGAFVSGTPVSLFNAAGYALIQTGFTVLPNGKGFLLSRSPGASSDVRVELILVQNFFEELKTKVPK